MGEWIKKDETVGIILFDINNRRVNGEVRHIPVDDMSKRIKSFVEGFEKKIVIWFASEKVPETVQKKLPDFLTAEKMVDVSGLEDMDTKSYCMFESSLIPVYCEKEVIAKDSGGYDYHVTYNKRETTQPSDMDAPFFPKIGEIDGLASDSLQDVVRYFLHHNIKSVLLLGYQKDIKSIVNNWGISLMLEHRIQPYLVPDLIDLNLGKDRFPYMNFPVCRDELFEKLCAEPIYIRHDENTIEYCRIMNTEVGDGAPVELANKSVYPRYNAAERPAFIREIYIKWEGDIISDLVQCFDGIGGYLCFSFVQGTFHFNTEGEERLSGYERFAHFEPGELISKAEVKLREGSGRLAGLKFVTTNREYKTNDYDHTNGDDAGFRTKEVFNSGGNAITALCFEYQVSEEGLIFVGTAETGYNSFLVRRKDGHEEHTENTLRFSYPYKICEKGGYPRKLQMKFEALFYNGYFYLYQNGNFLRKSQYLLMSSGYDGEVYKLTPELLEKSAKDNKFLPYADWDMEESEFQWQIKGETKAQAQLLGGDETELQNGWNQENMEFSEKINLYVIQSRQPTASGLGSQDLFQKTREGISCLKTRADLGVLAAAVNSGEEDSSGQRYGELSYQLEADLQWDGIWTPVGTEQNPFNGVLDGQGHVIKGICNGDCGNHCQGFFGVLGEHAEIKNLAIRDGEIRGTDCVGGIAGKSLGTISNCFYEGRVTASGSWAGGISGYQQGGGITCCCAVVRVEGVRYAGGLCGAGYKGIDSVGITFSYALSKVSAGQNGDWLFGFMDGMISRSCTALVYKTKMEEGECPEFWLMVLEKYEGWDFNTYTVPVIKSIAKQPQIECLRAHLQDLK